MLKSLTIQNPTHGHITGAPVVTYHTLLTVQDAVNEHWGFSPDLTANADDDPGGYHNNTSPIIYNIDHEYLRCKHQHGVLTGTYKSRIFDTEIAADRYLAYIVGQDADEPDIVVVGAGTTWDSQVPLVTTGAELLTNGAFENWTLDDLDNWAEQNCDTSEDVAGQTGSAVKITTSAAGGYIHQTNAVIQEKWYTLSGYYKNTAGDIARFGIYDATNATWITPDGYLDLDSTGDFTEFSFLFLTPPGCISLTVSFSGKNNGDIVWFDTCSVLQVDELNSTKWTNIGVATNSWTDIFTLGRGPKVTMRLWYGETSPPTNSVDKMEILSAIVENAKYFQVEITITDPVAEVYAYVEKFHLRLCQ